MKRNLLTLCTLLFSVTLWAQSEFKISHGPYLQELTPDGATFIFLTSSNGLSSIELKEQDGSAVTRHYASKDGLRAADNTFNSIRVENLKPGVAYQYRIQSKEVKSFQPYKVTFGDSIASPWYTFRTIDPKGKGGSFFITSDIHNDAAKLEKLLNLCDYKSCTAYFYAGDVMNSMDSEEAPFRAFIDTSVKLFATSVPFELVRGNHETRGNMARIYPHFFPKKDGKIYGSYLLGDIMVVMLDCGEDKPDTHPVYAGFVDFDAYRTEQAEWLKELVKSKAFKKARYRIVISHFPTIYDGRDTSDGEHGMKDLSEKVLPILNNAKIDLMISGHTHRYAFHEPTPQANHFPVIVGSNHSAVRLDMTDGKIKAKAVDLNGDVLLEKTF